MQGERGRIGSLPETLEINHGSASSNASIDQQLRWNDMRNPAGNQIRDYILSPGDMNAAYLNSVNQERQMSTSWSLGEPSSSNSQSEVRFVEQKAELGWSSSESGCPRAGPRLEERSFEPPNTFSVGNVNSNPLFVQSSNSDMFTQSLNNGGDGQVVLSSNIQKSSGSGNEWISPAGGSDQRACGYLIEDNDGRPGCSMEGRRLSRKRKAIEANIGQSSVSGSSSYLQRTDNNAWSAVPASYNLSSNLGASAPLEQVNPRLTLGATEVTSDDIPNLCGAGSSHRNSRLRINTQNQLSSIPPTLFSTEGAVGHSSFSSSHLSQRQLPGDYSLNLRSASTAGNMIPRSQPVLIHVPTLPRNVQAHRWNGGSSSGAGNSTNSIVSGDRDAILHAERGSRSMRNVLDNPMFVSAGDVRNQIQNPANRSSTAVNLSMPGNVASTSRTSASSIGHPPSAPLVLRENPLRFPRRLSICRTLFSSAGSDSGGQSSNHSPLRSGHGSSQEMGFSSVPANQGHPQPHPRSALWTERQGNSGLGIPYLLRPSSAAGGGSGRLVSEIRNALGLMRRGESLRYEDVMILDQSVYFGVADFLDRHGDMRLDVDNMSYEELLALEERIGNVSTGLNEETIVNRLKRRKCSTIIGSPLEAEPCCICQEEYSEGEDLGTLQCGHDFHAECIKQWLMHKNLCPICKTTALEK